MMKKQTGALWGVLWALFFIVSVTPSVQAAEHISARLVSPAVDSDEALLALDIEEGWHAYWRMPGEGGLAPRLDWSDSENIERVDLLWPTPRRFDEMGLQSFGYEGRVLFPLHIVKVDEERPAHLALVLSVMVCKTMCVPQDLSLTLKIYKKAAVLLDKAKDFVPVQGDIPGIKIENIVIGPAALVVTAFIQRGFEKADLFVDAGEDVYLVGPPQITVDQKDMRRAQLRITAPDEVKNLSLALDGQPVSLVLTDGQDAIEKYFSF